MDIKSGAITALTDVEVGENTVIYGVFGNWAVTCTPLSKERKLHLAFSNYIGDMTEQTVLESNVSKSEFIISLKFGLSKANLNFKNMRVLEKQASEFYKEIQKTIVDISFFFRLSDSDDVVLYADKHKVKISTKVSENYSSSGVELERVGVGVLFTPFSVLYATGSMDSESLKDDIAEMCGITEDVDKYFNTDIFDSFLRGIDRVYTSIE